MRKTLIAAILFASTASTPAFAQGDPLVRRVDKLEREVRAVQRKVFPGGAGQTVEPEIDAVVAPPPVIGSPASAPIADLAARVDALEQQLASLTGQSEQNAYKLRQLEDAFAKARTDMDARLKAIEGTGDVAPPPVAETMPGNGPDTGNATGSARPDDRKAAVAAIQKPSTSDAGEDAYLYGYRLWEAKFYPEAQTQLKAASTKFASHKRISFIRNLLGRAYLDNGEPALAATVFHQNYDKDPSGARAADSLYFLGVSLTRLKETAKACQVYAEFGRVYADSASATLKDQVTKGRSEAKCRAA